MKRKNLLLGFLVSMAMTMSLGVLTACGGDNSVEESSAPNSSMTESVTSSTESESASSPVEEGEVVFNNIKQQINLKLSAITDAEKSAAYYLDGVTATKGEQSLTVNVDLSGVDFTKAGQYTIVYSVDGEETTKEASVVIFGVPVISTENEISLPWVMATEENTLTEKLQASISAVDSMGNSATVSISGFTKNAYGFYGEGAHAVTVTAEDVMGNTATKDITVTLTKGVAPAFADAEIDLSNTAVAIS